MAKYLVSATEVYRVDSEGEVAAMIDEAKNDGQFELIKYSCDHKEKKQKGECIDEWFRLTLVKGFNDEKDPFTNVSVNYEVD